MASSTLSTSTTTPPKPPGPPKPPPPPQPQSAQSAVTGSSLSATAIGGPLPPNTASSTANLPGGTLNSTPPGNSNPSNSNASRNHGLGVGAAAGIGTGIALALILLALGIFFFIQRRRRKRQQRRKSTGTMSYDGASPDEEIARRLSRNPGMNVTPVVPRELHGDNEFPAELEGSIVTGRTRKQETEMFGFADQLHTVGQDEKKSGVRLFDDAPVDEIDEPPDFDSLFPEKKDPA